jgi:hypothetical protein
VFVFDTFPWPQFDEVGRVTPCAPSDNPKRGAHGVTRPTNDAIAKIDAVAAAARELRRVRAEALPKLKGGLRALYRTLELTRSRPLARPSRAFCFAKFLSPFPKRLKCPGANPLKDAHAALDTAVLTAYGFSAKKDLLAQLPALNQEVATKLKRAHPSCLLASPRIIPTRRNW